MGVQREGRRDCDGNPDVFTKVCITCGWDEMNEGDFRSGSYGYSPGTACPEAQHGSRFNEQVEWRKWKLKLSSPVAKSKLASPQGRTWQNPLQ